MKTQRTQSNVSPRVPRGLFIGENGNWWWRIKRPGLDRNGDTKFKAVAQNAEAALGFRALKLREMHEGKDSNGPVAISFAEAVPVFLEWYQGEHREHPNTTKRAATSLVRLMEFYRDQLVSNIKPGSIELFKTWRRKHFIKEVTIRHDLHNLSKLMQYGMLQNWCDSNPVRKVSIPSDKDAVRINVLSHEMERAYFDAAKQRSKDLYDAGRVMILQGVRPEEVMKMTKADIDLKTGRMHVFGKSKASDRWLWMTPETVSLLVPRLDLDSKWLFPSPSPINRGNHIVTLQRAHDAVCEETGVVCNVYDFRHTFATRKAVYERKSLPAIAALLGHSNMACLNKYIHPNQEHMDAAMDKDGDNEVVSGLTDQHTSQHTSDTLTRSNKAKLGLIWSNPKKKGA